MGTENNNNALLFYQAERPTPFEHRISSTRSRIKAKKIVLQAIVYRISSNIGREITTEKLRAAACIQKNSARVFCP